MIKKDTAKSRSRRTVKSLQPINVGESGEFVFFQSVVDLIQNARLNVEKQVNTAMVVTYFEIGRRIVEKEQQGAKRARYGEKIMQGLSDYLTAHLGRGYSVENLKLMRRFYVIYSAEPTYLSRRKAIGESVITQLSPQTQIGETVFTQFNPNITWTHYILLMRIANPDERRFYEIEIANNGWSFREFRRQYDSSLYERLALSRNKKRVRELAAKGQIISMPQDMFKDPYVLEFTGLPEKAEYTEPELEQKLIDHLQQFLLELGKGFAFMGRQVRFTYEDESFYVDLVFYNRLLRCFVLIDLKIGRLKHQDIGQMQMYVNYYDRKVKLSDENPTIGIVLCRDKKDAMVEMMLPKRNKRIFAAKYATVLPSKDDLRKLLE
jgi:predicted nuclease of restriction endonuclease-like (RecB) superfamily